ncbi:MAG: ABC transporter ATP-binding protein [Sulfolobales archaeon]
MSKGVIIEMRGIEKIYPDGQYALRGVDLDIYEGEIHGLLGENGAGKTTLMRILYGEIKPTKGVIKLRGRVVRFNGPWDAIRHGIGMVYQHFSLVPSLTVFENLYLSLLPLRGKITSQHVRDLAEKFSSVLNIKIPYNEYVEDLPVGVQQKIEILKILMRGAKIIILDEPTSVLNPLETVELFKMLKRLRDDGYTIIYITHKLREVMELTDRVTVLRRGKVAGRVITKETSEKELALMMVQGEIQELTKRSLSDRSYDKEIVLEVKDIWVKDHRGLDVLKGVSLDIKRGEILGIAGVQGNGQVELAEAIVGIRKVYRGRIIFKGIDITSKKPIERYRLGLSYIPDSRSVGLVYGMNLLENYILTKLREYTNKLGFINWSRVKQDLVKSVEEYNIVTRSLETDVRFLSGGNQQKILLARELSKKPDLLIVSEPTHGLDIVSTNFVRRKLLEYKESGRSILLISTDLDEIFELSDRIAVINEGKIVYVGYPSELSMEKLGLLMGGVHG